MNALSGGFNDSTLVPQVSRGVPSDYPALKRGNISPVLNVVATARWLDATANDRARRTTVPKDYVSFERE